MPFSYADPTSGPSAGGIGWFNFENLTISPGQTVTGLTGTLSNGTTVTFDLSLALTSGEPRTFVATIAPADPSSFFGRTGYTNIAGNVSLYSNFNYAGAGVNTFTMSNIKLVDAGGDPVSNYTVILADAETTNTGESWEYQTDGGVWRLLDTLGTDLPVLTGLGTQNVTISGTQLFPQATQASYVLTTQAPGQLLIESGESISGRQAISIGFATTSIKLEKYIAGRLDAADQFELEIDGIPSAQATTSGSSIGLQSEMAEVFSTPLNTYAIRESMAAGSVSQLADYTQIVTAANATKAGSIPPVGPMPIAFTPALGDEVTYTIINAIPQVFHKTVDKAYADIGDILTYKVVIDNPNDVAVKDVLFTDSIPTGTSYVGNLVVSAPYTGTNPASGLTILTIDAKSSVSVSWQVQINTVPLIPNPIVNLAEIVVPEGNSGMTNVVTTQIRTAYVTINKSVDKVYAEPEDILTYALTLNNAGNVVAENVVITDVIPFGTTLVPGSLMGATGTFPTLHLNSPIAAGGSAVVVFQVKIGDTIPVKNPIQNKASAVYTYTVDPADKNGAHKTIQSNTVDTLVNTAKLKIIKSTDKTVSYIGDTITYQISIRNEGNTKASDVVLTDILNVGTAYVAGSLIVSVPATGDPTTKIELSSPISPGQTVAVTFKVKVTAMPNPNPVHNQATATFVYTVDPQNPNHVDGTAISNIVRIIVFRYNFGAQISEVIESVALEQAALSAIANAEGAKIQRLASMEGIDSDELLCLNRSVSEMMDSITQLELILRQKLGIVDCQINGGCRKK